MKGASYRPAALYSSLPQQVGDRVFIATQIEIKEIPCDPNQDASAWNTWEHKTQTHKISVQRFSYRICN